MCVVIDAHCHLLQADAVERESFVKAWLGLNALPDWLARLILDFVITGGGDTVLHQIMEALAPLVGSSAHTLGCQIKMASRQFWPVFTKAPQDLSGLLLSTYPPSEVDLLVPLMTDYEE